MPKLGGTPPPYNIWAPEGHFSSWMSIDVPDVNTMFVQRQSNELQENHTQHPCNTPVEKCKKFPLSIKKVLKKKSDLPPLLAMPKFILLFMLLTLLLFEIFLMDSVLVCMCIVFFFFFYNYLLPYLVWLMT